MYGEVFYNSGIYGEQHTRSIDRAYNDTVRMQGKDRTRSTRHGTTTIRGTLPDYSDNIQLGILSRPPHRVDENNEFQIDGGGHEYKS